MKYILVSYYFPPDLGAGSFRSVALVKSLLKNIKKTILFMLFQLHQIDMIQT